MRRKGAMFACVGLALLAGGCDPTLERRYITEGAGVDLYTGDRANQVELLNAYKSFICAQVGPGCGSDWALFVQAGMNDIDQRCDGFLTWMDAKRRDKEPVLAQISAVNTAVHAIMTVTGSSPASLDIVTAAFGLSSATYANWNSRLLISVNQSTVQEIVYNGQGQIPRQDQKLHGPRQAHGNLSAAQLFAPLHADDDRGEHQRQRDARSTWSVGGRGSSVAGEF